jgi:hypothetical protein
VRPQPADYPPVQLAEACPDLGATVVVSPSTDDRVDRIDQFAQTQRYAPLGQGPDLILESVHRLLCGNGIEILPVQFGFDPVVGQFKLSFPACFVPRITTSRRSVFRGCRYSLMFRPPSLLSPQIVPTAANTAAGQPGILRPGLSCFVASTRTGYANRPNTGN